MKNKLKKSYKVISPVTIFQSLYLTVSSFIKNDLLSYASACTFGFLFSFIPIVIMTFVILIRFMHATPENVISVINQYIKLPDFINLENIANSITSIDKITNFEIVLFISIIWMARRFFSSIINVFKKIFNSDMKSKLFKNQLVIFSGEAICIVIISLFVFLTITIRTVNSAPFLDKIIHSFPFLEYIFSRFTVYYLPFILIFIVIFLVYKTISRAKTGFSITAIMSLACTFSYWIFLKIASYFINLNRYNIIYGVLSNIIVILMETFFFFVIFLFFAQWLYVAQYFDSLLICELYLLPNKDEDKFFKSLKRALFIQPKFLLRKKDFTTILKSGEYIYKENDTSRDVYYIFSGNVQLIHSTHVYNIEKGNFIGLESAFFDEIKREDAITLSDVELIKIPQEIFISLLERNSKASKKALNQMSEYFAKTYNHYKE